MCGAVGSYVYNTMVCREQFSIHIRIQLVTLSTVVPVVLAFYYTGGFFQPLLAFIRTFGCVGYFRPDIRAYDHLLVYWIGPTLAAVVLTFINPLIQEKCQTISCRKNQI